MDDENEFTGTITNRQQRFQRGSSTVRPCADRTMYATTIE